MPKLKTILIYDAIQWPKSSLKAYVFQGERAQWYFQIKARNGEIIAQSEGYKQQAMAIKTAKKFNIKIYEVIN